MKISEYNEKISELKSITGDLYSYIEIVILYFEISRFQYKLRSSKTYIIPYKKFKIFI